MPADFFLDSNIMIYAFSGTEPEKRDRARALLEISGIWVSTQVLNELANVMAKKFHQPFPAIRQAIEQIVTVVEVHAVGIDDVRRALSLAERYRYSYYDSLILATAISLGCTTLYTEDMQHGQSIDKTLTIINPFETALCPSYRPIPRTHCKL